MFNFQVTGKKVAPTVIIKPETVALPVKPKGVPQKN